VPPVPPFTPELPEDPEDPEDPELEALIFVLTSPLDSITKTLLLVPVDIPVNLIFPLTSSLN
jgi:hypothetical protein